MSDVLYIVIPAYNESENIEGLIASWYPIVEEHNGDGRSRLVIINDGSKDNTFENIYRLSMSRPLLVPLNKRNGGHGDTVLYGYRYALKHDAEYIFQTDSDGQTNPAEFQHFWDQRKSFDAIFGNRTHRGDGRDRVFVEKVLCIILRVIFDVKVPDSNAPFRLMSRIYVEKYIKKIPRHYNLPNVMLTLFGVYYNDRVKFIPISFKPRQGGKNSMNVGKIIRIGLQAVRDFIVISRRMSDRLS